MTEPRCTCAESNATGATSPGYRCHACAADLLDDYNVTRFACHCGRFLAESAIRSTDHRDDSRYYGIRTEVEWTCSRCGVVKGEEWDPPLVVVATHPLPRVMPTVPHPTTPTKEPDHA